MFSWCTCDIGGYKSVCRACEQLQLDKINLDFENLRVKNMTKDKYLNELERMRDESTANFTNMSNVNRDRNDWVCEELRKIKIDIAWTKGSIFACGLMQVVTLALIFN